MEKITTARKEGKREWLYNGKVVIAVFRPLSKSGQQADNKEKTKNSILEKKRTRATWTKRGED